MTIGTKALKNGLSEYLRRVKEGETVYVTDRGRIVAQLTPVPPAATAEEEALRALAAAGGVTLGTGEFEDFEPRRTRGKGKLASRMIIEDRA